MKREFKLSEKHEFPSSSKSAIEMLLSHVYMSSLPMIRSGLERCVAPAHPVDSH